MMNKQPIFVYISGTGKTLEAIINKCEIAEVTHVYSDTVNAPGLVYAQNNNISLSYYIGTDYYANETTDVEHLQSMIDESGKPKMIVLAGFMKLISADMIDFCDDNNIIIINIHPSLLPKYKGLHTHQRVLDAGDDIHGFTVHYVTPELDSGDIIAQQKFIVQTDDTVDTLSRAVKIRERNLFPGIIDIMLRDEITNK